MSNTVADLPGRWSYLYKPGATLDGDTSGWKASVMFETDYSNLVAFVTQIGGAATTITTGFGSMSRIIRMVHPDYAGLYAMNIRSEACGQASTTSTARVDMYSRAKVMVDFAQMPFGISGDQAFMTWEIGQGSVYTTVPGRKFSFPSGEPVDQDSGAFAVLNSYKLTLYNVPSLDDSAIDLVSTSPVNNATFQGKAAGHLLFGGCQGSSSTVLGGVTTWQKSYTFTYRSTPWNQTYQRNGTLDTPVDPAGNPQYATSDFNTLLS